MSEQRQMARIDLDFLHRPEEVAFGSLHDFGVGFYPAADFRPHHGLEFGQQAGQRARLFAKLNVF